MKIDFNCRSLTRDDNFFPCVDLLSNVEGFELGGISDGFHLSDFSLVEDSLNQKILESYVKYKGRGIERSGFFQLEQQIVFDNWGVVCSALEGAIFNGTNGFGWPQDAFKFLREKGYLKAGNANDEEFFDYPNLEIKALKGFSALLTFPGALTYGHWIVDIWGRVEILKRSGVFNKIDDFILPAPMSAWMRRFISFFEIDASQVRCVDKLNGYACDNLFVPTVPSQLSGGVLPYDLSVGQFRPRAQFLKDWFPSSKAGVARPLFLRHRHLTSSKNRSLANADDIAQVVKAHGGRTIDPTKAAIGDVIQAIQEASIVVGQDSSALHNIAFVGRPLLVIETERRSNLIHVSIQDAMSEKIGYVQSEETDQGWEMKPEIVSEILERYA